MTDHSMYQWAIKTFNPHRPAEVASLMRRLIRTKYLIGTPPVNNPIIYRALLEKQNEILTALKQLKHWHGYCHKYNLKIQHWYCKKGVTGTWQGKRKATMPADIQLIETTIRSDHGRRELHV